MLSFSSQSPYYEQRCGLTQMIDLSDTSWSFQVRPVHILDHYRKQAREAGWN